MNSLVSFAFIFLLSIAVAALSSTVPTITNNSTNDYTINDTPAPGNVQIQDATGGKSYKFTGNAGCILQLRPSLQLFLLPYVYIFFVSFYKNQASLMYCKLQLC